MFLLGLAPTPDRWASWRWLTTPDERVLWTMVLAVAVLLVWGAWSAWHRDRA